MVGRKELNGIKAFMFQISEMVSNNCRAEGEKGESPERKKDPEVQSLEHKADGLFPASLSLDMYSK